MSQSPTMRHSATLDSLRALSALVVLLGHVLQVFWYPVVGLHGPVHVITSALTETSVIVFFLLSGFLITASILANIRRHGCFVFGDYAVARLARIYPPLLVAIALTVILYTVMRACQLPGIGTPLGSNGDLYTARETLTLNKREVWSALLMTGGLLVMNGPLWSLYIEVRLYALAGLVGWLVAGGSPLVLRRLLAIPLLFLLLTASLHDCPHFLLYAAWWIAGALCCVGCQHGRPSLAAGLALCGLAGIIVALSNAPATLEVCRVAVMALLCRSMFFRWKWRSPFLESFAGSSYTLYLVHFPISLLTYSVLLSLTDQRGIHLGLRSAASAVAILLSLGIARLLAHYSEDTAASKAFLMRCLRLSTPPSYAAVR